MIIHGPYPAEDTNLALHIFNLIVQSLPNQRLHFELAAQVISFKRYFLKLFIHHIVAKLALFLNQLKLLSQFYALLLKIALVFFKLFKFLGHSLLLALYLL